MIFISNNAKIRIGIKQGNIYNFSPKSGVGNHYYIVLNKNPKTDEQVFFVYFTTKKQKVVDFIKIRNFDILTMVEIKKGECSFLSKRGETCVNCNYVFGCKLEELVCLVDNSNGNCGYPPVSASLLERILSGIKLSKMVSKSIKNLL